MRSLGNVRNAPALALREGRRYVRIVEPMAEELRIQAIDLANVQRGMEANQPVTVAGLNSWGIIQVVSGLVSAIEPNPDRSAQYPFRVVIVPRGRASLTPVDSNTA
jgi:hypothetical protein